MAQPIYSTSVSIDQFKGLNQTGDGKNMSLRYAVEMENVNVHNGSFSPMREGVMLPQELDKPIGTLAYLSRRFVEKPDTLLVAISDGKVFTKELDGDDEWVKRYEGLTSSEFDWVTYESSDSPVFLPTRTYVKGERCKHMPPAPEPYEEVVSVHMYRHKAQFNDQGPFDPGHWEDYNGILDTDRKRSNVVPIYVAGQNYKYGEYVARDVTEEDADIRTYKIYYSNTFVYDEEWVEEHWSESATMNVFDEDTEYTDYEKVVLEDYETVEPEDDPDRDYKYYKCKADITTPEDWTDAHWDEVENTDTVDVLLLTNAKDGMYCLYGDTLQICPIWVTPDPENNPEENIKFGVIARYNERIWGTAISGDPDRLVYSCPYNPFDWTPNAEIPEDGAGDIFQPTWDGDSFTSLEQFGTDLMAIKRNSIWRIYGTHPGEFVMARQYGGGTIQENTVAVHEQYVYMLGEHGMMRYDSVGAYPFLQDAVQKLMRGQVNRQAISKACAGIRNGVYCLALPINGSEFCNAILEYNISENTISLRTGISVDSFLQVNERLFYTSSTAPGKVIELEDETGTPLPCKWISGYQDLGLKNSIKSAFILYMMVDSETPVQLWIGLRTEKKLKQKIIMTKPKKMTRLHLNTQGREFRLEIASYSGIPFTIAGGIKLDLELDPD